MRRWKGFFIIGPLVFAPGVVWGATVVKFGATLCGDGYVYAGGACVENDRARCPAGFVQTPIDAATYAGPTLKSQCMNTYNRVEMPEFFHAIYNGVVVKFGATLCAENEQMVAGKCTPRVQGRCADNYYKTAIDNNTFTGLSADGAQCMNSYNVYEMPDYFSAIYNGILVNFGATLCGDGFVSMDGACVTRSRGECPENFYDVTVDDATLVRTNMGVCDTGYAAYGFAANCGDASGGFLCAVLCDAGLSYTGVGTCATRCGAGMSRLMSSTGLAIPLYTERQITPSINVSTDGATVCYGNLVPGTVAGTLNVMYENKTYHSVD